MRLAFVIVATIFTALFLYAKLMAIAAMPAGFVHCQDDGRWPGSEVAAPISMPHSH
jgi:hypothetical protein